MAAFSIRAESLSFFICTIVHRSSVVLLTMDIHKTVELARHLRADLRKTRDLGIELGVSEKVSDGSVDMVVRAMRRRVALTLLILTVFDKRPEGPTVH